MKTLFALIVSIVLFGWLSVPANAAYSPKGKCFREYKSWKKLEGYGAFSVSRNGRYCGWSSGFAGRKKANRAAQRQCRSFDRKCRIYSTSRARAVKRLRSNCRKLFNDWRGKNGHGAFALAKDGSNCNAVWDAVSLESAKKQALDGCKGKSVCDIYKTILPDDLEKARQRQLMVLGFYSGKIDGKWGRGSRRAADRFAKSVGLDSKDEKLWDVLRWATLILRDYDTSIQQAIENAVRAESDRSIEFMNQIATRRDLKNSGTGQDTADINDLQQTTDGEASSPNSKKPTISEQPSVLGFRPKVFQSGLGVYWKISSIDRKDPSARFSGRCQLVGEHLAFAYFDGPPGLIVVADKQTVSPVDDVAEIIFNDSSRLKLDLNRTPDLGSFIPIANPFKFIDVISKETSFRIRSTGGNRLIDTNKIKQAANAFLDCIRKINEEPLTPKPIPAVVSVPDDAGGIKAEVKQSRNGQFIFLVEIDALPVRMLFDTGASFLTIPQSLAEKLGSSFEDSDFNVPINTANGITNYAPVVLKEIRIGSLVVKNVEAAVLKDSSLKGLSLLGMSFVNRLKGFAVEGEKLVLRQ